MIINRHESTAAVADGRSIEPFSVLDWLEDLRDDHAELRD